MDFDLGDRQRSESIALDVPAHERALSQRSRAKSSLRLKYEAETQVIERKIGSLESIRQQLGLSQRKMAQLLLVDPSAWTRWTKGEDEAPPHIYRMLQWYLALEEKYPVLDVNFWLNTVSQVSERARDSVNAETSYIQTQASLNNLEHQVAQQKSELAKQRFDLTQSAIEAKVVSAQRERSLRRLMMVAVATASLVGAVVGMLVSFALR